MEDALTVIGTKNIAVMMERYNGAIRCLEECMKRPLIAVVSLSATYQ